MVYNDMFITIYILVVSAVFGSVFGSFINCMAWRIVNKESILKGRSHCTTCGHMLGVLDLIPIFSYILSKGRCRYCKEKYSPRYMVTELILAVVFMLFTFQYDISFLTLRYLMLSCILLGLSLVDFDIYEIPNRFIVAGIVVWIATIPFIDTPIKEQLISGLSGGFTIGGSILLLSLFMDFVLKKESMGGGDIKLFFMLGLYMGPILGLFHLIISCFVGIFFVIILRNNKIPFGPAISIGAIISLLWGNHIVSWYIGLFY